VNPLTADEEMRMAYGELKDSDCQDCVHIQGNYCDLTTMRRKCSGYGSACKRFEQSGKYKFVVK
jgi:hypothetical protein